MPHDAEVVAPEDVPFDVQVQDAPVKASPLEIECACMTAHGATAAEIAARFGIKESAIKYLRTKPAVKLLVGRYAKDPGSAGRDVMNVGFVHAMRKALALVDSSDPRIALKAIEVIAKLVLDMQKMPASQVQINLMQGVTVQAQAIGKEPGKLREDAELAVRVAGRFIEASKEDDDG